MGGGKKGGQTIGFWYIMTVLCGLGRGASNGLLAIEVDDKLAWVGEVDDDTPTTINKPKLFGGEKKEGGIVGGFRLFRGKTDQVLPAPYRVDLPDAGPLDSALIPNVQEAIGGRVSQLRRIETLIWRGTVSANNYYPKEWHFLRWRTTEGWFSGPAWYPEKATIWMAGDGHEIDTIEVETPDGLFGSILRLLNIGLGNAEQVDNKIRAMNPAHIIYECLTDPEWGAKRSPAALDENSFILAANTLCSENFGLCFNWARQEEVDTFIQTVIDHIGGVLYSDRSTGKIVLRLIRNDYDPDELPHYDKNSGLLEIEEDDSASSDEAINEIIVKGKDQSVSGRGRPFEVRCHHVAGNGEEGAISQTIEFPGIPTRALALRVGQRELRVHASGLKRFKLKLDRRAWRLVPGAVIKVTSPENDLANMILRVGDVEHGSTEEQEITVRAMEDVFGMPEASFQSSVPRTWVPPDMEATPAAATRLIEAGYRDLLRRVGPSDITSVTPTAAFIGQLAQSANYAYQYELASKAGGETDFVVRATGSFTFVVELTAAVEPLDTEMLVSDVEAFEEVAVGEALLIGDEIVRFEAVDADTLTITVARGCVDTIPQAHAAGDEIWTLDDDLVSDGREYASAETVETKVLTITPADQLELDEVTADTVTLAARHFKPLPPGNVRIDGQSIFAMSGIHLEPVLTFTDRDRLTQADQLIEHEAASVGPEAGTTYTVRVLPAGGGAPLRTATVTSPWTYDAVMQVTDGSPIAVEMELESVRDSIVSWQKYSFHVTLSGGYGLGYGYNYGGDT
jgi:hypothetical protein